MTELRKEIESVFEMSRYLLDGGFLPAAAAFAPEEIRKFKRVVITGCGDSFCASIAAKACFEALTGLYADAPACLEFSRHYDAKRLGAPGEALVILVSFSGKVSRVVEAAERARRLGAATLAVTHDAESPVARACERLLHVRPDEYELKRTPGCRTYIASMLSLFLLAGYVAKLTVNGFDEKGFISCIWANISKWEKAFPEIDSRLRALAWEWAAAPYFEFLSAGPELASAWFGEAKIYEATGDFAKYENFEDWAHVDYILRKMDSVVFLFATSCNPSVGRAAEVESVLARQGYRYLVLSDTACGFKQPDRVLKIPSAGSLWLNPMLQALIPCAFADYFQQNKGTNYFCCDMIDTYFPFGGSILRNSAIDSSY